MTPRICLFAVFALALVGCGGNGSTGSGGSFSFVTAKIPIGWGSRAREFGGPGSALSVVVTLDDAGSHNQNVAFEADRSSSASAYTQTYTTTVPVLIGIDSIHVRFYSQPGGVGDLVAQCDASVQIDTAGAVSKADGSALGTIQATGVITSVNINGPSTIVQGTPAGLSTTAFGNSVGPVAVSPGSISYQIISGTGSATINSLGQIVGSTFGSISVTATIDGIVSPSYAITVTPPPPTMTSLNQVTSGMTFDAQTGHLWATVPATDPTYGNSVIEIDPVTEQIVSRIPVGSSPTVIAISDDGTALYVGLRGSDSFARVDPIGKTLVATYPVNSSAGGFGSTSQYAASISVQPGNPNVVALAQQDEGDSGFTSGCIYNQGVLLPNHLGSYNGEVQAFSDASTLWGSDPGFSPQNLFQSTVNSSGATLMSSNQGLGGTFSIYGGNLYFNNGQVVSGTSGTLLGTFSLTSQGLGAAVDLTNHVAYLIGGGMFGTNQLSLSSFDATTFTSIATYPLPNGPTGAEGFTLLPSGGFAFEDGSSIYFLSPIPGRGVKASLIKKR